jgi:hypothetical protein
MTRSFCTMIGEWVRRAIVVAVLGCWIDGQLARAADFPPASSIATAATVGPAPVIDQPLPPAFSQEVPEPQPSPRHVWVAGHWRWQEGSYVWIAPRWELPPVAKATWVPPRWEKQANGYVLIAGYWDQSVSANQAVVEVPAPPPTPPVAVTTEPPPPLQREVIVERPSPTHVWINGYWAWRGNRHVWVPGHWERPPADRLVWVEPRWERRGNGYVLVEGYWRNIGPGEAIDRTSQEQIIVRRPSEVVVIREAPPPPRREYVGPRPSPRHVWINGYWALRAGRNVWVAGHWEIPPRGRSLWEEPRWERRSGGYIFIEGHWR